MLSRLAVGHHVSPQRPGQAWAVFGLRSVEETGSRLAGLSFSKLRKTGIQVGKFSCTLERHGELLKYLTFKILIPRLHPRSTKSGALRLEARHVYL